MPRDAAAPRPALDRGPERALGTAPRGEVTATLAPSELGAARGSAPPLPAPAAVHTALAPASPALAAAPTDDAPVADDASRAFGAYDLRYRIASGGMATVYLARRSGTGGFRSSLAVKIVHPHFASDPKFAAMFLDEARLTARLHHPNVCTVFDYGAIEGTYYLAMEYLRGEALSGVMARTPEGLPPAVAARIVADAARGLHAAHELKRADGANAGVVHRDVSPQNVFVLYDGVAKVVDFGIARWHDQQAAERTAAGELKGKAAYMSPEQLHQRPIDRRADVFALGVVLWEITLGVRLFKRESAAATMLAVLTEPVPPPSSVRPGYPRALEAVVMRALAREPADRFPSADAMARALEAFLAEAGAPAGPARVADFMRARFADRIAFWDGLLAQTERAPAATPLRAPLAAGDTASVARDEIAAVSAASHTRVTPRRARPRVLLAGALAAAALLAALAAAALRAGHTDVAPALARAPDAPRAPVAPAPPVPSPVAASPEPAAAIASAPPARARRAPRRRAPASAHRGETQQGPEIMGAYDRVR